MKRKGKERVAGGEYALLSLAYVIISAHTFGTMLSWIAIANNLPYPNLLGFVGSMLSLNVGIHVVFDDQQLCDEDELNPDIA